MAQLTQYTGEDGFTRDYTLPDLRRIMDDAEMDKNSIRAMKEAIVYIVDSLQPKNPLTSNDAYIARDTIYQRLKGIACDFGLNTVPREQFEHYAFKANYYAVAFDEDDFNKVLTCINNDEICGPDLYQSSLSDPNLPDAFKIRTSNHRPLGWGSVLALCDHFPQAAEHYKQQHGEYPGPLELESEAKAYAETQLGRQISRIDAQEALHCAWLRLKRIDMTHDRNFAPVPAVK